MSAPITVLSSMATKPLLAALGRAFEERSGRRVALESVGGVIARKRVEQGEVFDVVVLARDAIDALLAAGRLTERRVDVARSGMAAAVRAGAPKPAVETEDELRRAVLAASSIGHSTGPSGVKLREAFERWGIAGAVHERIVIAPPGVAVGTLVARGDVELGFQQRAELSRIDGIAVLGPLPATMQLFTTFSAAIGPGTSHPESARALLSFMAAEDESGLKRTHGMEPA
jgi:molybdate transport system substrate-binding protein